MNSQQHISEVSAGNRFTFGENWTRFLRLLDERRIQLAEQSLKSMLDVEHLRGMRFLDVGSGSGLFSLAARRLGAVVRSFDYDPQSVACTTELRKRSSRATPTGRSNPVRSSTTDYLGSLGEWDVVYSWGVRLRTSAGGLACNEFVFQAERS